MAHLHPPPFKKSQKNHEVVIFSIKPRTVGVDENILVMARSDPSLQAFLQPLRNDITRLYALSSSLSITYRQLAAGSSELFSPTATTRLPTGREKGRYLAVYVGLHYLRVAFIELLGEEQVGKPSHVRRTLEKAWPIEDRLRRDQATELFAWIGDRIAEVIHDDLANSKVDAPAEVAMGISFCFPIKYGSHHLIPPPISCCAAPHHLCIDQRTIDKSCITKLSFFRRGKVSH